MGFTSLKSSQRQFQRVGCVIVSSNMRLINDIEEQLYWYQLINSAPSDKNFRWNFNSFKKIPTNIYLIVNNKTDSTWVETIP